MLYNNLKFNLPTEIHFGIDILKSNPALVNGGKKAFIVTGHFSGEKSGALSDCINALNSQKIEYMLYDKMKNNPNVCQCKEAGEIAKSFNADFIIGIGGGSPLDAAKAIAVFAKNDIPCERIFTYGYENGILPIIAIPTTSGTGSEVTPWSVMTRDDLQTKRSFGGKETFPKIAILDPKYTESLSEAVTLSTAADAFTHCFESFISLKSTPVSEAVNKHALGIFGECVDALLNKEFTLDIREKLMMVSLLGGITISNTGTTIMHALGYPLTYFHDMLHGIANVSVFRTYIKALECNRPERLEAAFSAVGIDRDKLLRFTDSIAVKNLSLTKEQIKLYSEQTSKQGSCASTGIPYSLSDIEALYNDSFGIKQ